MAFSFAAAIAYASDPPTRRQRLLWAGEAQSLFQQGQYAKAARSLEKAVAPGAKEKDLIHWLPVLGQCYEALKNYQKALTAYQQVFGLQPKNIDRMLDLARIYKEVDLRLKAIDLYERVFDKQKKRKDVVLVLAFLYFESDQLDQAKVMIEKYISWEPRDMAAQDLLAKIEESFGELQKAAHRREAILSQQPTPEGFYHLGRLWACQSQFDLAEMAFDKAEKLGLQSALFYFQRGVLSWQHNDAQSAERFWKKTLQVNPTMVLPRFFLALNDFQEGEKKPALQRMKKVETITKNELIKEFSKEFIAVLQ